MASTYSAFLQTPSSSHLASDASINYITTTTAINESTAVLKHLQAQAKQVTTKEQKILNAIEAPGSLFLETETTLQFNNGGGAYLPQMDENLLDEKMVTFPLLHVVNFDEQQKIKQIRLHWDQGTLLKQVEAIGRTGRNWPIRDGKAQVDAISRSLKSSGIKPIEAKSLGSGKLNEVVISQHKRGDSVTATRDPHASLALFAPRDPNEQSPAAYEGPKTSMRASAKPAPRDYGDLFAGENAAPAGKGSQVRSPSPSKADGTSLKSGAGKHHMSNRIFDQNEPSGMPRSPEGKKTYSQKYDHFTFGDGQDSQDAPSKNRPTSGGKSSGGQRTFSFEDFSTPPKHQSKARPDDEVHWGGEDEPPSPLKRPIVHAARKDADTHFKFADQSSPATTQQPEKAKSLQRQKGMGLYEDPLAHESNTVQNTRGARSGMTANWQNWGDDTPPKEKKIYNTAGDGMGGRKTAGGGPIWGNDDTPPKEKKIYNTAGDGMGGRKTVGGGRGWGIGDDSDPDVEADKASSGRGRRQQSQAGAPDDFSDRGGIPY